MDGKPEVIAAGRRARKLMEKAKAWEAMSGEPDGATYKAAALAMHRALLLEKLWKLDQQGSNERRQMETLDRMAFLRDVIRANQTLSDDPEALAIEVVNIHTSRALELWPQRQPERDRKLVSAIARFLRENSHWSRLRRLSE